MKHQKLTFTTDEFVSQEEVDRIVDDCCKASALCAMLSISESWVKLQNLPGTNQDATTKLKEASQLIREAVNIVSSSYYEYQSSLESHDSNSEK